MLSRVKFLLSAALLGLLASTASAQVNPAQMTPFVPEIPKRFPGGLSWKTMGLVGFNYNYPGYEGTPAERELAWAIWGPTIEAFPENTYAKDKKWSASVILAGFENDVERYVFSSMDAASVVYPGCEDAINSKDPNTPIYTNCPLRITMQNKRTGQAIQRDVLPFCHLATNDADQPKSRNYVQVAVSSDTKLVYFRVVQYGKPAPECNRAIRLK